MIIYPINSITSTHTISKIMLKEIAFMYNIKDEELCNVPRSFDFRGRRGDVFGITEVP